LEYPGWLKIKASDQLRVMETQNVLRESTLDTVCERALCPNLGECFSQKTATFLIMGNICTRNCRFCAVSFGTPAKIDNEEPFKIAGAVKNLGLRYVVITSVTRDDLSDGGADHFARCIRAVSALSRDVSVEVLVPDFSGNISSLNTVLAASPTVLNHNLETISRLYSYVRPDADYSKSLRLLEASKCNCPEILTKSGIMLGLGETEDEVIELMRDLSDVGCDFVTIGQYLAPSKKHHQVKTYIEPERFEYLGQEATQLGFKHVASGPLVRSSYRARDAIE